MKSANPSSPLTFVLASTSPRRIAFLKDLGLKFQVLAPDCAETVLPGESARHLVARLAQEKAEAVRERAVARWGASLLLSADTVVVAPDGKNILGKPCNLKEARQMLEQLSGVTHTVFTGFALTPVGDVKRALRGRRRRPIPEACVQVVKTRVTLRALSSGLIQRYIATGEPMDKAGAYGAQGLGAALIEKVQGSYTNVVGLPLKEIGEVLESWGIPLFEGPAVIAQKRLQAASRQGG